MTTSEYTILRKHGRAAEAVINGILRGGFVHDGTFYAHAGSIGVVQAQISAVSSLRIF